MAITNTSGQVTNTSKPTFLAYRNTSTGALSSGTTIIFDTEASDQGNRYNNGTGIFTAPAAGKYLFTVTLVLTTFTATDTGVDIVLSSGTNYHLVGNIAAAGEVNGCVILNMATNDTVKVNLFLNSGTAVVSGPVSSTIQSYFSGTSVA